MRRFTEAQRARILTAAKREALSGPKAARKFGISTPTYYAWRKKAGQSSGERTGRVTMKGSLAVLVREDIRVRVRELLPSMVLEEVARVLGGNR